MADIDTFRSGSRVSMPLWNDSNTPLNALDIAPSVSDVLTRLPENKRYVGLAIFCKAENALYRFTVHDDGSGGKTSGILDSDFKKEQSSGSVDAETETLDLDLFDAPPTPPGP